MHAIVTVMLKNGVLDPQGKAVEGALAGLGFDGIQGVRIGKSIEIDLGEIDKVKAAERVDAMCKSLLVNTVVESYSYVLKAS